jgi:hypothetical protein
MTYIPSHQSLANHPKTLRLMRRLDLSRACTIGHLHQLWWWCLDYALDGDLTRFDSAEIALAVEWNGDADVLMSALIDAGFIDERDGVRSVHDWEHYGGKLLKRNEANRTRMRESRAAYEPPTTATNNDDDETGAQHDETRAQHVRNTTGARVEPDKIRIDKRDKLNARRARESAQNDAAAQHAPTTIEQRFDQFWGAYPVKRNKQAALKVWRRIKPDDALTATIIASIEQHQRLPDWTKENGRFIPYPSSWLNAGGWQDELDGAASSATQMLDGRPIPKGYKIGADGGLVSIDLKVAL